MLPLSQQPAGAVEPPTLIALCCARSVKTSLDYPSCQHFDLESLTGDRWRQRKRQPTLPYPSTSPTYRASKNTLNQIKWQQQQQLPCSSRPAVAMSDASVPSFTQMAMPLLLAMLIGFILLNQESLGELIWGMPAVSSEATTAAAACKRQIQ